MPRVFSGSGATRAAWAAVSDQARQDLAGISAYPARWLHFQDCVYYFCHQLSSFWEVGLNDMGLKARRAGHFPWFLPTAIKLGRREVEYAIEGQRRRSTDK